MTWKQACFEVTLNCIDKARTRVKNGTYPSGVSLIKVLRASKNTLRRMHQSRSRLYAPSSPHR